MRIVFMGTPVFALPTLEALHQGGHEIIAVYTQPPRPAGRGQKDTPSPVHAYALEHKLPVFTPVSLKSEEDQKIFASHKADIAVVVAYGLLLPKAILTAYPLGCINVHPSLLPRWRGAAPIQRTVMAGDTQTGVIIMQMNEGLDTGDMLMAERYMIPEGTTAGKLHDTLSAMAGPLVMKTLEALQGKKAHPMKQPEVGVTYAKKISKEEARINWDQPARSVYYHILGLSPFPGAHFSLNNESIKIFDATCEPGDSSAVPGTVVDDKLGIACNPGILRPALLQRPGKKSIGAEEFLRGFALPKGTKLE